jgi:hypothetical protein
VRGSLTPNPEFDSKCVDVGTVYRDAPAAPQQHVRTVSVEIRAGVGARRAGPADCPGDVVPREFEYIRCGNRTLIATFNVATGQVLDVVSDTRTW